MKKNLLAPSLGFAAAVAMAVLSLRADPPVAVPATPSALESDPAGWKDLLPDAELHGWQRHPYAGKKLVESNPWSRRADEDVLRCARLPMSGEQFLCDQEFGDGIFHVEWRFLPVENARGYNSGVFVRNSADGVVWHQAQVGDRNVGYLFGSTLADGKLRSFKIDDKVAQRGRKPGEWNTYEVTCQGRNVTLWINGGVTATWTGCEVARGQVGLEAEGWDIEFRNVKFKEIKSVP